MAGIVRKVLSVIVFAFHQPSKTFILEQETQIGLEAVDLASAVRRGRDPTECRAPTSDSASVSKPGLEFGLALRGKFCGSGKTDPFGHVVVGGERLGDLFWNNRKVVLFYSVYVYVLLHRHFGVT